MKRLALALVVLLALTGCTVTGSLIDKAQIDVGLASLTEQLEALPGVTAVESHAELQSDYTYVISIAASADALSDGELRQIGAIAMQELGSAVFERQQVAFSVGSETGGTQLGLNRFTGIDLDRELDYLSALSTAYGAPLGINFYDSSRQIVSLSPSSSPDWEAMRAIPDHSPLERSWYLNGLSSTGELPDTAATDLADALWAIVPSDSELMLDITGVDVSIMDSAYGDLSDPMASPSWSIAQQVAALVAGSALVVPHFAYYGDGSSGFAVVHHGSCTLGDLPVTPEDEALAAALGDAEWHAGYCPPPV